MRVGLLSFILMMEGANQEDDSVTLMPRMDKALLTDFVDRWDQRHIHFIFPLAPFGKMTVTLKDIAMLTGLLIRGRPVVYRTLATISPSTLSYTIYSLTYI
jgi:hypothetical protein